MFSTESLNVRTSDGRNMVLLDAFSYTSKTGRVINVPIGATSDGASTPREIWSFIPPFGKYWMAAFLHDYLYRSTDITKDQCDDLLREAMEDLCVDWVERDAIFQGVTIGGQSSFNEDRGNQTPHV